jgi:hypothetical protein
MDRRLGTQLARDIRAKQRSMAWAINRLSRPRRNARSTRATIPGPVTGKGVSQQGVGGSPPQGSSPPPSTWRDCPLPHSLTRSGVSGRRRQLVSTSGAHPDGIRVKERLVGLLYSHISLPLSGMIRRRRSFSPSVAGVTLAQDAVPGISAGYRRVGSISHHERHQCMIARAMPLGPDVHRTTPRKARGPNFPATRIIAGEHLVGLQGPHIALPLTRMRIRCRWRISNLRRSSR